jgi:hypothetical protein
LKTSTITKVLLLLILSSCNTEKRCNRILNKAQRLQCISFSNDTITINDTVNGFYFDTLYQFDTINDFDTLLIDTGGVRVKTIINWKTRTVGQSIKKDTVYLTNTITVTKTQIQKRQYSKLERYTIYFALFVIAVFLAKLFSK